MKLYDPNKCNSFEMNFGFKQPHPYKMPSTYKDKRTKLYENQRKHNGKINKYKNEY